MSAPKVGGSLRGGLFPDRATDIMRHAARSVTVEQRVHSWMTETANAQASLDALRELIPLYFYRFKNASAIVAFLLFNSFALQREAEELREGRQELEDHIARLKSRVVELEERDDGAAGGEQKKVHILSAENARLRLAQAELCRINEQWALDYEALVDQRLAAEQPPTDQKCLQLEQRVEELSAEVAKQAQNMRETNVKLRLVEDEKSALRNQLQELGTFDEVLAWKNDASRLRALLKQRELQYQEVVAINLQTRQQLQKLQQASHHALVSRPTRRPTALNLSNPRRSSHQPLTPPGLLSREVEKDIPAPPTGHAHQTGAQPSDILVPSLVCPGCSWVTEGTPSGYPQWCKHVQSCGN
ncbi:hypothetical protein EMCRGX_G006522 [Ephydatia muelleri]